MPVNAPTPIIISRRTRNILLLLILLALAYICWRAPAVPKMVISGAVLAVLLSFPVRLISRWTPRGVAIAIVLATLLLVSAVAVVVLVPLVVSQLTSLIGDVPKFAETAQIKIQSIIQVLAERGIIKDTPEKAMSDFNAEILARAQTVGQTVLGRVLGTFSSVFGLLLSSFGVFFVALYMLADTERFKRRIISVLPIVYRDDANTLWDESGEALSRYLSGLLVSLTFQGVSTSIVLYFLGVPYSLLLGIWTAIAAIVPYVGSYIGGVPAVIAGLFVSPLTALLVAATYFTVNQIDGNLIAPRVQGKAIGVHPVIIFLGVIAGGQIAGLYGALLAVPLIAIMRVFVEFFDQRLHVEDDPAIAAHIGALPATGQGITPVDS
jgi:predicted PurR-regulated permease PerM